MSSNIHVYHFIHVLSILEKPIDAIQAISQPFQSESNKLITASEILQLRPLRSEVRWTHPEAKRSVTGFQAQMKTSDSWPLNTVAGIWTSLSTSIASIWLSERGEAARSYNHIMCDSDRNISQHLKISPIVKDDIWLCSHIHVVHFWTFH